MRMKRNLGVVRVLLFHGCFSWLLDVAYSTSFNHSSSFSTLIQLNSTRNLTSTPAALPSQISTLHAQSTSITFVNPTSYRLQSSTSHWLPFRTNETTAASPTKPVTSPPTLGPLASKLPLFAVISGVLGLILLVLLVYIVWNLCIKDCSLSRVQPSVVVT